jgi:hypothetical protein
MASMKDLERVADDLEKLVGEFRSELKNGPDFDRLVEISDEISEHADDAAQTFSSVNEMLMSRISDLGGGGRRSGQRSSGGSREKTAASA